MLPIDDQKSGHFFPKLEHFFSNFEKEQGRSLPLPLSSYASALGPAQQMKKWKQQTTIQKGSDS